RNRRWCIDQQA
uniref:Lumbricusin n=1 Tax=Lumbricus terrestris TaxID=6398 RepID=LMCSN_LUMTE|nr:RecName: Full=Lumbricusin [Lumbricus terrestris]